ncbi:hypothetical protein NGA_0559400 [Nannochloropsis gaditana CCMP526]|nr:hypothetical protein NGA_0559400 [Nannochloropsis gaditana CCMP526]EKU20427.1 hypothetical protein NGA_0559400 [Nannochloropsis gaditana CCMP526]|eukprot:XP_005855926.1 hypothetical protein NGA_0559400 [Nannochloropsis gaditana CCMP526]
MSAGATNLPSPSSASSPSPPRRRRPAPRSTPSPPRRARGHRTSSVSRTGSVFQSGYFYMSLLALQFGLQPLLVRAFIPTSLPKMLVVMATESVKILLCALGLWVTETKDSRAKLWATWTVR